MNLREHLFQIGAPSSNRIHYFSIGRYSEDLVKKRRYLLEKWINRVARHPVLAQSTVFQHFISVCSEQREKVSSLRCFGLIANKFC